MSPHKRNNIIDTSVNSNNGSSFTKDIFDVGIIGGGFGGLSAALLLGRYLRSVIVFDVLKERNYNMHGYLGFENSSIKDAIQKSWSDVLKYESVKRIEGQVETVKKVTEEGSDIFLLSASIRAKKENNSIEEIIQKKVFKTRYVIFATGVEHPKPKIKNFNKFLGNGIWHCPHCDGFASTNKKLVIIASNKDYAEAIDYAKVFLGWTRDVTLFLQELESDKVYYGNQKNNRLTEKQKNELTSLGINVIEDEIITEIIYDSKTNTINSVLTNSNRHHKVDIVFYHFGIEIQNEIAQKLGCELDTGYVKVNEKQQTTIANVYAVGDMDTDRHYAILASASGATAALAIYEDLLRGAISITRKNNSSG
ncbi:NAD(P)/FAD-dependent oxidoreductase [Candidatus Nitrosocosmicus sp. T]